MSEATAGTLVGYLRLDASQWYEELRKAGVAAEALDRESPKIDVHVNAEEAVARLHEVGAAADAMGDRMRVNAANGGSAVREMSDSASSSYTKLKDAGDKLAIAEARLAEARANSNTKTSSLLSAERGVELARRGVAAATKEAEEAEAALAEAERTAANEAENAGQKVEELGQKAKKAGADGTGGINPLAAAIGILGPAIAPVGAAAAGLGAGFAAMGAAGVVAVLGIKNEMAQGTALGSEYAGTLARAKATLDGISHSGAVAFFGSVSQAVGVLQSHAAALTPMLSEMSVYLGHSATALIDTALSAFEQFRPVIREVGAYVVDLADRLNTGVRGDGFRHFIDYVAGVVPQVLSTIESLVMAVGNLVQAASPLGGVVLTALEGIASAISAIDPSILQVVATLAGSVYTAFQAYKALQFVGPMLEKVGIGGSAAAAGMEEAATGAKALNMSLGVIAIALGAAEALYTAFSSSNQNAAAATASYTDALIQSNGAINDNVRLSALKRAQDDGAIKDAQALGLSTNDVVDAYLGQNDALAKIGPAYDAASKAQLAKVNAGQADASTMSDLEVAQLDLNNKVHASQGAFTDAKTAAQQHNEVLAQGKQATSTYSVAAELLASSLGTTAGAVDAVNAAQQKAAVQASAATLQMQLENNAAGLLKQSLDALSGKSLSAAQAQNQFDSALSNMGDHISSTGKKITFTTTSINDMSSASVALRGQLLGQVTAAESTAEAYGQMTGSSEKGREKLVALRDQIIKNAVAHGVDKKAVEAYIDSVLKVPKSVPPTKLDVDKTAAEAKAHEFLGVINGIPTWRSTTLSVNVVSNVRAAVANIAATIQGIGASVGGHANGDVLNGSGAKAFANGGITAFANGAENHVAQIAPAGAMRLWAEPETGGEAYIPLSPAKRDRSLAIWEETGKRLGALGKGGGGDNSQVAAALLALASELQQLHTIPSAIERGMAQNARAARLDARARYSA